MFLICGLVRCSVFDEESDVQVKIAQFQRPEVENRGSRFLIVGFLIVCLHHMYNPPGTSKASTNPSFSAPEFPFERRFLVDVAF